MRDYMKTLLARFDSPSKRAAQLAEKVNQRHRQLAARLSKPERKLLLRLIDLPEKTVNTIIPDARSRVNRFFDT